MATLDRIMQLQAQGIADPQITAQLQQEGISATEINDSLNQAKIKNAVSPQMPAVPTPEDINSSGMPAVPQVPQAPGMNIQAPAPEMYPPAGAQMPASVQAQDPYAGQTGGQDPYQNYYQQTPQGYSNQGYYDQGGGAASSENVSEIAEQVATEKLNEYKQKVGDVGSFINKATDKINDIDDRLKRIEGSIDKLQQAVIGKIGEFGESSASVHKDLENLHNTVGKLMNPLVDTYNELKKK